MKVVAALVKKNFPDFCKTIGELDSYLSKGVLDAGILSLVTNDCGAIDDVLESLKNKDVKQLRALAPKYVADYLWFVGKLAEEIYSCVTLQSIICMYEIVGENNQYYGIVANTELYLAYLFIQLACEMQWK